MTTPAPRPLLVAIGDSDAHGASLAYAVGVARHESRALRLVHVVHPPVGGSGPENMLVTFSAAQLVGEGLLHQAAERVRALSNGQLQPELLSRRGPVVATLLELAADCDRVVLQHRQQSRLRRVFTGSVVTGLAARCPVPVVSVPEFWSSWTLADPRIVVGVDDADADPFLLDDAFATAAALRGTLTVLHGWFVPSSYAEVADRAAVRSWGTRTHDLLVERLEPWRTVYPDVDVHVDVRHERPVDALVDASRHADLLLIGRNASPLRPTHLGSLTRALVRESLCPLEVVPAHDRADRDARPEGRLRTPATTGRS